MKFKLSNAPLKPQLQNPWLFLKVLAKLGCYSLLDSNIAIIHMLLLRVLGINISPAVTYWDNYIGLSCVDFVSYSSMSSASFKGCGMGPWLVLVSPCFRENVVATCKLGLFLCSLDNLLQKKRNCFLFLEIKFQNGPHLKKEPFLTYFSHFLVTRESYKNFSSTHLIHLHTHILLTLLTFFLTNLEQNTNLSGMVSLWYDS